MKETQVKNYPLYQNTDIAIKPWMLDRPRRASIEVEVWLGAMAFVETVLAFDKLAWTDFMELVHHYKRPGCQQVINEAMDERFNSYEYANKLFQAKQGQKPKPIPPLMSFSARLQRYETDINNGNFNNKDFQKQIRLTKEFAEAHCNSQTDFENGTCKITIEKSPLLYVVLIMKPLYIHLGVDPDGIDERRFGKSYDTWANIIYGNPRDSRGKAVKSSCISQWERLEARLHNDGYYLRKAELLYRVKVNPGSLVRVVDEICQRDGRNPRTVKRQIQSATSLIKFAVMPGDTE